MDSNQDLLVTRLVTRIVLKKYNGDGPADRTDDPIETLVIEDGVIVEHY